MFLHRIHLNPRCREARRDLSDPYQLHSTLCRAFSPAAIKCPENAFLWRLEPETDPSGHPRILIQSGKMAEWSRIEVDGWLAGVDPAIDLRDRLSLDSLDVGQRFRFRLRANPCVTRNGKRLGLLRIEDQEKWVQRKSQLHGFSLPLLPSFDLSDPSDRRIDVRVSQGQMLKGKRHPGGFIRVFSVLYDGILKVTDLNLFKNTLKTGIGHGKVMGNGLLSVVPLS